ncbi:hypothetical protein [Aeromonas jandaei]
MLPSLFLLFISSPCLYAPGVRFPSDHHRQHPLSPTLPGQKMAREW